MSDFVAEELGEFFDYIWHDTEAYVYLPVHRAPFGPKDWQAFMYSWPKQRSGVIKHILKYNALTANVYYSPALFKASRPTKENVLGAWHFWVDFDGNAPEEWAHPDIPEPTMRLQSSIPGHQHCYWALSEFLDDIEELENKNRALAYMLKADTSGWDADQILRPIHTMNHKRNVPVTILKWDR